MKERDKPTLGHLVVPPEPGEDAWEWGEEELRRPAERTDD